MVLDGYSPWVTGAEFAQHVVLGATLDDGRQILVALPTDLPGVRIERSPELVGLSASRTGPVHCERVFVSRDWLLAGPIQEVMKQGVGAKTGGLQTSALAIGLAGAAIEYFAGSGWIASGADASRPNRLQPSAMQLFAGMLELAGEAPQRHAGRSLQREVRRSAALHRQRERIASAGE